ncbi:hypothetical protein JAAARDRAFT_190775 [Jaapia argillacea MUCL 33604]|uniref:Uncharacterized protein n=1 Tax=Jaapia argillacea MUCL 33604 TaxID=933084 RepID=A0A067Q358_9AGAM|nr:hypothetical protein JAAARDRAFT_190775 [Jaapia argillacea MUCL 33604]
MSTSTEQSLAARSADTEALVRTSMSKGYQLCSLLTPPAYTAFVLLRRGRSHFSVNSFLRATWLGGVAGVAGGGAVEYVRSRNSSDTTLRTRRIRAAYNTDSIRADDHSTIGAILFAVLTPAVFWKRARIVHLVLGGAGVGSAIGVLSHYCRTLSGDPPPRLQIPISPSVPPSS